MAFDNPHNGTFSASQIKIAGNYVELEMARITRDTIGNGWNVRQMSVITSLGSIQLEQENGAKVKSKLVTEIEDGLMKHFDKTRPIIRKDIQSLINDGMCEKDYIGDSKKNKTLRLSENGYALWLEYNGRRAALFVAAGKTIEKLGGIPYSWVSTIKGMIKRFFKGTTGMSIAAMFIAGGSLLAPMQAQAWELQSPSYQAGLAIDAMTVSGYDTNATVQAAIWDGAQDPMGMVQSADAASFLEDFLPKGAEMNAWQGDIVTYQASPRG